MAYDLLEIGGKDIRPYLYLRDKNLGHFKNNSNLRHRLDYPII